MPNIWVVCETRKFIANILCLKCESYIVLFLFFSFKYFSSQHQKQKNESVTYIGPIILWLSLNENGPRFAIPS
jgi:hypothetical protein